MRQHYLSLITLLITTCFAISCDQPGAKARKTDSTLINTIPADSAQRIPGTPGPAGTQPGQADSARMDSTVNKPMR